ncbi:MAG: PEP-utilizing enzyme, partial [Acidimicrobiia bacterium]
IDGGRAAARDVGDLLVARGELDDVEDVFFFTMDELNNLPEDPRLVAKERRERRDFYRSVSIPVTFTGTPEARVVAGMASDQLSTDDDFVRGAAGSLGTVEGIARVVSDPQFAEPLEPGEILVCRFTDPSWTPLLLLAAAVIIDIGGPASHGAIVARELGIPCVIGTGDGTLRISTGDLLHVDGSSGTARIIDRNRGSLQ